MRKTTDNKMAIKTTEEYTYYYIQFPTAFK